MNYKKPVKRTIFLFLIAFASVSAYADQAAWVSRAEAARALEELAGAEWIRHYCAPCGDKAVRSEAVQSIGLFKVEGENYWEIRVNGKGVDLAYVYFEKKGKWRNAAMAAKIKVQDVPKELSDSLLATAN
ncbi:MAG: hypothetical protein AB7Q37_17780 [Pyrinomonadaceae bacterium]